MSTIACRAKVTSWPLNSRQVHFPIRLYFFLHSSISAFRLSSHRCRATCAVARKSARRVRQPTAPQVMENTPNIPDKISAATNQCATQGAGCISRFAENPRVATEKVRNNEIQRLSCPIRNPCHRVYGSFSSSSIETEPVMPHLRAGRFYPKRQGAGTFRRRSARILFTRAVKRPSD
jgi:hypothetical protein